MRLILAVTAGGGAWLLARGGASIGIALPSIRVAVAAVGTGFVAAAVGLPIPLWLGAGSIPLVISASVRSVRRRRLSSAAAARWPDFVALIRSRIAAGEPLPDAVRAAARAIGGRFRELDRSWAGSFDEGLRKLQRDWADATADQVLTTLRIAAITGGAHVDDVLSTLTLVLSEDLRLRRAHEAAVAQQQMTAGVALLAPWLILALSLGTNPQAAAEFSTHAGHLVIWTGVVATAVGYWLARRSSRLSRPPRVFG